MKLKSANLESKSIDELCFGQGEKEYLFRIPTYQRGFRWDEHVVKLIEDLLEFKHEKDNKKNVGEYYCLQPIIVKRLSKFDDESHICYEVVDGQQRLTTIFILLKVFGYNKKTFRISFERDSKQKERETFLSNIEKIIEDQFAKADFYFMKNALNKSLKWLGEMSKKLETMTLDDDMRSILMKSTRIIWYELEQNISGREVFRNINYGKLPLTNSELIKAMMLNSKHYSPKGSDTITQDRVVRIEQERMARLWDEIESALQNEDFWAFISGGESYSTRIDYIFELIFIINKKPEISLTPTAVFNYYGNRISEEQDNVVDRINLLWNDVRKYFRTFQDWYADIKLYNYIGYLVHYLKRGTAGIILIKKTFEEKAKDEFLKWLQNEIKRDLKAENIIEMTYEEDRKKIEKLLLLFNVETLNCLSRRFDFVVSGGWSVEHVFARHSVKIQEKDRIEWIQKYIPVLKSVIINTAEIEKGPLLKLEKSLKKFVNSKIGDFESLFDSILSMVECKGVDNDSISNLALIGLDNNATLGNSAFYEKREKIIDLVENGHNIPQCTVNLFMKFYSGIGTNLDYWSANDGKAYLQRMEQLLCNFITGGKT
ncbi:MAG: DUF262 domain-containing protein [Bacillota bacterium]